MNSLAKDTCPHAVSGKSIFVFRKINYSKMKFSLFGKFEKNQQLLKKTTTVKFRLTILMSSHIRVRIFYPKFYTCRKIINILYWLMITAVPVYIVFIFPVSVIGVLIFNNLTFFWNFRENFSLALHLVEMGTDPDPPNWCIFYRIWIHNTAYK